MCQNLEKRVCALYKLLTKSNYFIKVITVVQHNSVIKFFTDELQTPEVPRASEVFSTIRYIYRFPVYLNYKRYSLENVPHQWI